MPAPELPETPNWCREGLFARYGELTTAVVVAAKSPYFNDLSDACPDADNPTCAGRGYVVRDDVVVVAHSYGVFRCTWYTGATSNTVGWLRATDLAPNVLGTWKYGANEVTLLGTPAGLTAKGTALWRGLGDNVHFGEIEGPLTAVDGGWAYDDGSCKVSFRQVGAYLALSDNGDCGGANVRFDGVYHR